MHGTDPKQGGELQTVEPEEPAEKPKKTAASRMPGRHAWRKSSFMLQDGNEKVVSSILRSPEKLSSFRAMVMSGIENICASVKFLVSELATPERWKKEDVDFCASLASNLKLVRQLCDSPRLVHSSCSSAPLAHWSYSPTTPAHLSFALSRLTHSAAA